MTSEEGKQLLQRFSNNIVDMQLVQQYNFETGMKKFGHRGKVAAVKEVRQQHACKCFSLIAVEQLMRQERQQTQEALMYLTEKCDRSIKGRMVYNGKPTRDWLSKEEAASPTVTMEGLMLTTNRF